MIGCARRLPSAQRSLCKTCCFLLPRAFSLKISPTELNSSHGDMLLFELNPKLKGLINKYGTAASAEGGTSTYLRDMRRYCECESERFNLRDVAVRNRQSVAVISGPAPVRSFRRSRLCLRREFLQRCTLSLRKVDARRKKQKVLTWL